MKNPYDNEERKTFHEMVSKFMETEIWPHVDAWDEKGSYPQEINEKVCQLGVLVLVSKSDTEDWASMTSLCAKLRLLKWDAQVLEAYLPA